MASGPVGRGLCHANAKDLKCRQNRVLIPIGGPELSFTRAPAARADVRDAGQPAVSGWCYLSQQLRGVVFPAAIRLLRGGAPTPISFVSPRCRLSLHGRDEVIPNTGHVRGPRTLTNSSCTTGGIAGALTGIYRDVNGVVIPTASHRSTKLLHIIIRPCLIMKLTFITSSVLCGLAAAASRHSEPEGHEYRPEKDGDRQSHSYTAPLTD